MNPAGLLPTTANKAKTGMMASATPPAPRQVPEELKGFNKTEVSLFIDKIPNILKEDTNEFLKCFELFLEGVVSVDGFTHLVAGMFKARGEEEHALKQLTTLIQSRE